MNILFLGGTRFFGVHAVRELLQRGHHVTIATRGNAADPFGDSVQRIRLDRTNAQSVKDHLSGLHFDVIIDNICYCSNDVRNLLDVVTCDRYVMTSSASVYLSHTDIREEAFDPMAMPLEWCCREDHPYEVIKQLAEAALFQHYPQIPSAAVRYTYVVGPDDYTGRMRFYVEHAMRGIPMHIDNLDSQIAFIHSSDAGKLLAHLAESDFRGSINACSPGTISVGEILAYVQQRTGKAAILSPDGEPAPYNGEPNFHMNIDRAAAIGFHFPHLNEWIYSLLDHYIHICR